jgi:hypothetical protein
MEINNDPLTNDMVVVGGKLTTGGTLTVTNIGPAFLGGETFKLFNTGVTGFTATNLPALTGVMYWTNKLAVNGTIAVVNPINTNPPIVGIGVGGSTSTLSWPTNAGWTLQAQTNSLGSGSTPATNGVDLVPGSTRIASTNITVDPAKPTMFYRLKL